MIIARTDLASKEPTLKFVAPRAMIQGVNDQYSHIGYYQNDKIVGGVIFSHYDGHNIWMHLALDNPRAMRRSYAKQVFEYCFYKCKCVRITAMTKPTNARCIKLIESAGFKKEGRIRKVIKENLQYSDGLIYGLLRKECRYL